MKMRKIGRILTVMFLTGGLMTGCQKKQTVVLPEKEQKEEATETESKNKETANALNVSGRSCGMC